MSFKSKFLSAITASFAVAAFSTFAAAQETPRAAEKTDGQKAEKMERKGFAKHGERGMRMGGGMHGLRGIELSDVQKEQLRKIHEANRPNDAARQELRTLAQAKRDGTITADQQERMRTLRSEARAKGQAVRLQIEAILTPEQRQQIETRKVEMEKKRQERREQRRQKTTTPTTNDN